MVEFVLLFPLALLLILALVEFGFALSTYLRVTNAAAEGARYGAVAALPSATCDDDSIEDRVLEASGGGIGCAEVAVTYQAAGPQVERGDGVAVRVTHAYQTITPLGELLALFTSGGLQPMTISACSNSRLEQAPSNGAALVAGAGC
jgi:Flp pilus assembly protein TadG